MLSSFPMISRNAGFDAISREMDRLFEAATTRPVLASAVAATAPRWPVVNLFRHDDRFVVEAEIPGFRMEDVEVLVDGETLILRGTRDAGVPEGATPLRLERSASRFERSFRLPAPVDAAAVEATLEAGVLRVEMPLAEAVRPRRVEVRSLSTPATTEALPEPNAGN